jgi:uncharacterized membrane protein
MLSRALRDGPSHFARCWHAAVMPCAHPSRQVDMVTTFASALAALVAIAALASAMGMPPLPEPLAVLEERLPGIFRLHMASSGMALLLLPWILLLRHRRSPHRLLGRAGAVLLLVGAATALPVALRSEALPLARAGFFIQGSLCLVFLIEGVKAIRERDIERHAQLMLRVSALVFGAVVLRIMMAATMSLGLPFDPTYATVAWLSWMVPLMIVSLWPKRHGLRRSTWNGRFVSGPEAR